MRVEVVYIEDDQTERAQLYVKQNHKALENLVSLIDKETYRESYLSVYDGKEKYQMSCIHIFYIESENDKAFVYTSLQS